MKDKRKIKHRPLSETLHISTLITGSIFLVALLGIIMTGFSLSKLYYNSLQESDIKSDRNIVYQINNNINYYVQDLLTVASYIKYEFRFKNELNQTNLQDRIESIKQSQDDIIYIALFELDGTPIATTYPSTGPEYIPAITAESWFTKAINDPGEFFFSAPRFGLNPAYSDYLMISYSTVITIKDENTNLPKPVVLLIDLDYDKIEQTVMTLSKNYSEGYFYIISENDELICYPNYSGVSKRELSQSMEDVKRNVYGSFISSYDGVKKLTVIDPIQYSGWRLVGVINLNTTVKQEAVFRDTIIASLVVIIIYAIIISTHIASYIASPIKQLESVMRHVQNGNFDIVVPVKGSQETQSLSISFEKMLFQIKSLMASIKKAEEIKKQREIDALQAKINPHFLYNTLESVVWLAESGDNKGVVKQVTSLSTLFRVSIAKGKDIITIQEELTHVKSYLEIQSIRYKDKFDYTFIVPEELRHCPTTKLIVQPIVENAIYHGLKYTMDEGHIIIKVEAVDQDKIAIKVSDNGIGMDEKTAAALFDPNGDIKRSGNGIGIININERLKLTYGDEYGLSVESELEEGTTITILIPRLEPIQPVTLRDDQMVL